MATGSPLGRWVLEAFAQSVGPTLIRLLAMTLRLEISGASNIAKARSLSGSFIYAVWHGRLLVPVYVHRDEGVRVLVSMHQDGEYIARVMHGLGFGTVRGSSTRGGTRAVLELTGTEAGSHDLAITPDGPRGPRERCQAGIIYVAKKNRMSVIPVGVSHKPSLVFSSWDRFMVPLPFAKCMIVYGEPAMYDDSLSDKSIEEARLDLERRLRTVTLEADNECGRNTR